MTWLLALLGGIVLGGLAVFAWFAYVFTDGFRNLGP